MYLCLYNQTIVITIWFDQDPRYQLKSEKTLSMELLNWITHISTSAGPNRMANRSFYSHEHVFCLVSPKLSDIPTPLCVMLHVLHLGQILKGFLQSWSHCIPWFVWVSSRAATFCVMDINVNCRCSVNHWIFECTLRSLVFRGACLFECHWILNHVSIDFEAWLGVWELLASSQLFWNTLAMDEHVLMCTAYRRDNDRRGWSVRTSHLHGLFRFQSRVPFERLTSNQVGLPAELKHINKRRKRN